MFDLLSYVLAADYFDGARFHTFKAADDDAARDYARKKGWAVDSVTPARAEKAAAVVAVLPPRIAPAEERQLVWAMQARDPDVVIHPVGAVRDGGW